ncbi:MAG: hypothetical protein FWH12_08095 [Treponema sp.]|nr:hypothetical protein [Treponema sp.]
MSRKFYLPLLLLLMAGLSSCTDLVSTSLAPWAARDPNRLIPPVTPGNVDELLAMTENSPDMSMALLRNISSSVGSARGSDRQKLQNAAMKAAVNAVGLGQSVLQSVGQLGSIGSDGEGRDLILDTINTMPNLISAGTVLASSLPHSSDPGFDDFAAQADPNDLALAAVVILAGEAKKSGFTDLNDYVDHYHLQPNENEELALALAYAAALDSRQDELNEPLRNILQGLNLH